MTDAADVNSVDSWLDDVDDVAEGYLVDWLAREGSTVDAGETLCEIQVERVSIDVAAPTTGIVTEIVVAEGGDFARGDVLVRVQSSV